MKKSRFTEEQIVSILRKTDRDSVPTVATRHGVSEQTVYTWKQSGWLVRAGRRSAAETARAGDARLKKLVAKRDLEIEVIKEIATKKW